jgi:hypothetical protein
LPVIKGISKDLPVSLANHVCWYVYSVALVVHINHDDVLLVFVNIINHDSHLAANFLDIQALPHERAAAPLYHDSSPLLQKLSFDLSLADPPNKASSLSMVLGTTRIIRGRIFYEVSHFELVASILIPSVDRHEQSGELLLPIAQVPIVSKSSIQAPSRIIRKILGYQAARL